MIDCPSPKVVIPGYKILHKIYDSNRTTVYQAQREDSQTPVAIKILKAEYPQFRDIILFRNQYSIARSIQHPHIIKCYSLEPYRNSYALILEDFGGISLNQYRQSQPVNLTDFFAVAIAITSALEFLYDQKIIHKDIKPNNILINPETKQIKLIDFSISSLLPKENSEIKSPHLLEGTLAYMSPEQTGRMNRGIDYRSDFYSLGVTFYELLTGKLPFDSNQPLELIHCHLAQEVINPSRINPNIPPILAKIVLKLMAKNAEQRYQTAKGIKYDLEYCQQLFLKNNENNLFKLGEKDISDRFQIPDKLYGRETEVKALLNAFERIILGSIEIMLISGFSGIGKTAVVHEVHKQIVSQKGYFISGKFDQFQRDVPFSALVQAFRNFIEQILTESVSQLEIWKKKIFSALGDQGRVITDVIPELKRIIGEQPEVAELRGSASQNRFNLLFGNFIQLLSTPEHPLVIFLDDLQWADSASLKLIKLLMSEMNANYLLIIGAYRNNEVRSEHPLMMMLNDIRKTKAIINEITLTPLNENQINHLIADTLKCSDSKTIPLTNLVMSKTEGNPLFTNQLLKSLHEEELIKFNFNSASWEYNLADCEALYPNNDVVQFLAKQLQKLPKNTQNILKIAACIGNKFDLYKLSIVAKKSQNEIASDLWIAIQEGFIIPINEAYKLFTDTKSINSSQENQETKVNYTFLHDRLQQAAYSLITETHKKATHLKIGQLILKNLTPEQLEENLFEVVNQLNIGADLISEQADKYELAHFNLLAGRKAKLSTAYENSVRYLNAGLGLLAANSWDSHYQLTLEIYVELVESAYLNIHFNQARNYAKIVKKYAKVIIDQVKVYEAEIQMYMAEIQMKLAIDTGLKLLDMLGVTLEEKPPANLNPEDLIDLPEMMAEDKLAAMRILTNMISAAYFANPGLLPSIVFTMIHLSVRYGNSRDSAYGYVLYGLLLCSMLSDVDSGYRYGELALSLLDKFDAIEIKCKVLLVFNSNIKLWKQHIRETLDSLVEGLHAGLAVGDIEYVGYISINHGCHIIFAGENLISASNQLEEYTILLNQLNQQGSLGVQNIWKQVISHLTEEKPHKYELNGIFFNEAEEIPLLIDTNSENILFSLYVAKTILFYCFKQIKNAIKSAVIGKEYAASASGQLIISQHNFYYSLALLADYHNRSEVEQKIYMSEVTANQEILQKWAEKAPMNYQHKYNLVAAEIARVLGNKWHALELYDLAILGARENSYIQEEAIANELAAQFYLECGKVKIAQPYLIEAYYSYVRWGAKTKVLDLEKSYPDLLSPIIKQKITNLAVSNTNSLMSSSSLDSSSKNVSSALDLETITKASLAISSEIQLDKLLHKLMQVILENMGADKASLMLVKADDLMVVAQCQCHQECQLQLTLLRNSQDLPISLINYVYNTQEYLIINDATSQKTFANDPYIIKNKPKSVLCTPILNQGKLIGIIYLENALTVGVFTPERLKLLQLLSSQAAISIENAHLYTNLEEKVAERTQELEAKNLKLQQILIELKKTQLQLIQTEKMSSLGQMVAGVAHEINNPINFIYANIEPANNYIESLLHLISIYQQEFPSPTPIIEKTLEEIDFLFLVEDLKKLLISMKIGADRIRKIVLGLRNFSRLDESEMKPVDIHEGIDNTLMFLQPRLKAKPGQPEEGKIEVIKEYNQLPLVNCYASQLNQVFMNIISNSIDALNHLNKGRSLPEIQDKNTIIIRTQVIDNNWVRISIKDNGLGISKQVQKQIFDPFFTTKTIGEGTGLGLSISYQIVVDRHGGKIECISEPGRGTEFLVDIPIR
ncbi:AAA family ATPase [Nodularia chucula]|uniref:trifunctional serine/threonine-protein kinase/ATP-binding protein/sensor histidine kinase n=1 Tax=Nodularia chucula TaxID=3093667 RepID=UPI0039C5AC09